MCFGTITVSGFICLGGQLRSSVPSLHASIKMLPSYLVTTVEYNATTAAKERPRSPAPVPDHSRNTSSPLSLLPPHPFSERTPPGMTLFDGASRSAANALHRKKRRSDWLSVRIRTDVSGRETNKQKRHTRNGA